MDTKDKFTLKASAIAIAPSSPMALYPRSSIAKVDVTFKASAIAIPPYFKRLQQKR